VKLPIGVALRYSLAGELIPSEPMCAVIAEPTFFHPPPAAFVQAWSVATVLERECAVTVSTRVAEPVEYLSGSDRPFGLELTGSEVTRLCAFALAFGLAATCVDGFAAGPGSCEAAVVLAPAADAEVGWRVTGGLDTRAVLESAAGDVLDRSVSGNAGTTGRSGRASATVERAADVVVGSASRLIPTTTTAPPATASTASPEDSTLPIPMWPVCQL